MIPSSLRAVLGLLLAYTSLACAAAAKGDPKVGVTPLDSRPAGLFYFDDSDVVIVHDTQPGIIYRSTNAGAEWHKAKGVAEKEPLGTWAHPYNNRVAIIIGARKTHWITRDQGETWDSFLTDHMPTLGPAVLSYHATDPDKIIFHTTSCDGFDCTSQVC